MELVLDWIERMDKEPDDAARVSRGRCQWAASKSASQRTRSPPSGVFGGASMAKKGGGNGGLSTRAREHGDSEKRTGGSK